ncbi:hypothetical protein LTR36_009139 [Oleoguttula mirabilis]|uniref:Uncharacterized protein n=1 Tax=Oleoguttula mirabilis TaxID=1507867 RepID=A0AAV9J743_9PEZI|nr:hypothetical protein LTR36_009139 [Oleoguttula mirabilis]
MKLRTRRALINFAFFGGALCFILYLNIHQSWSSDAKTFAWTTVRYQTTAAVLPAAHGKCPGLAESSKPALVVSRVSADGDPKWLDPLADLYHACIYNADTLTDEGHLQVPANRGHEAMAYLTFIVDNYEEFPTAGAVFVHGSRWAWHNDAQDYDNAALLAALNVPAALEPMGYHNLRCDWSASTCAPNYGPAQGSLETSLNARLQPWDARAVSDAALSQALTSLFGGDDPAGSGRTLLGRGDKLRAQCCAQFVVSRQRVWQHSREEYVALRQWLLDGSSDRISKEDAQARYVAPADDRIAGRILSYIWHIIFLPQDLSNAPGAVGGVELDRLNELACPRADDCYCRLYGRCNLEGCNDGGCHGQYVLPPDFSLPEDWAATHP